MNISLVIPRIAAITRLILFYFLQRAAEMRGEFSEASCFLRLSYEGIWRPHRDSNADLKLRRLLFYPVKLWEPNALIITYGRAEKKS